jgi:hypothetical protein
VNVGCDREMKEKFGVCIDLKGDGGDVDMKENLGQV